MSDYGFDDPEFIARYAEGPPRFVPGYEAMQSMAAQLLWERAGDDAEVLVVGAGGGLELRHFAHAQPGWHFAAVDPSEEMIKLAQLSMPQTANDRVSWTHGYIQDAPSGPYDGATCLLTLHFIPDDGSKLAALKAIRRRLRDGAAFALVDHCLDKTASDYRDRLNRYAEFASRSGASIEVVDLALQRLDQHVHMISPDREEQLMRSAGFRDVELFYAGFAWHGWVTYT